MMSFQQHSNHLNCIYASLSNPSRTNSSIRHSAWSGSTMPEIPKSDLHEHCHGRMQPEPCISVKYVILQTLTTNKHTSFESNIDAKKVPGCKLQVSKQSSQMVARKYRSSQQRPSWHPAPNYAISAMQCCEKHRSRSRSETNFDMIRQRRSFYPRSDIGQTSIAQHLHAVGLFP